MGAERLRGTEPEKRVLANLYGVVSDEYLEGNKSYILQQLVVLKELGFLTEKSGWKLQRPERFGANDPRHLLLQQVVAFHEAEVATSLSKPKIAPAIATAQESANVSPKNPTPNPSSPPSSRESNRVRERINKALTIADSRLLALNRKLETMLEDLLDVNELRFLSREAPLRPNPIRWQEEALREYEPIRQRLALLESQVVSVFDSSEMKSLKGMAERRDVESFSHQGQRLQGHLKKLLPSKRELKGLISEADFLRAFYTKKVDQHYPDWHMLFRELGDQAKELDRQFVRASDLKLLSSSTKIGNAMDKWGEVTMASPGKDDAFTDAWSATDKIGNKQDRDEAFQKLAQALVEDVRKDCAQIQAAATALRKELENQAWFLGQ
jgi:hypothetical protein